MFHSKLKSYAVLKIALKIAIACVWNRRFWSRVNQCESILLLITVQLLSKHKHTHTHTHTHKTATAGRPTLIHCWATFRSSTTMASMFLPKRTFARLAKLSQPPRPIKKNTQTSNICWFSASRNAYAITIYMNFRSARPNKIWEIKYTEEPYVLYSKS